MGDLVEIGGNFPGYQAGASLKPPPLPRALNGRRQLPRLPSRGLIEARREARTGRWWTAKLPRLPSRGLIEAAPC